jgi:hypothetical protein
MVQWALESKWGAKPGRAAQPFGIKKATRHDRCCTVTKHGVVHGILDAPLVNDAQ